MGKTPHLILAGALLLTSQGACQKIPTFPPHADRDIPGPDFGRCRPKRSKLKVLIIGIDGLSPDGILKANTPNLDRLMREGSYSLRARAVFPTVSGPNWVSILSGAGPEQHGVRSNDWNLKTRSVEPSTTGVGPRFPSIFDLLKIQRPQLRSFVVHDWKPLSSFFNEAAIDDLRHVENDSQVLNTAVEKLRGADVDLSFVYFVGVDDAGHQKGHGSSEYYRAVERADHNVGVLLATIEAREDAEDFTVFVVSDHGGLGRQHAGGSMPELLVPWVVWGAEVEEGKKLQPIINSYDTAATAAHLLGLCMPTVWEGQPVLEALD